MSWLGSRPWVNAGLVLAYLLFILFMHDFFVSLSVQTMFRISLERYDLVVGLIALLAGSALLFFLGRMWIKIPEQTGLKFMLLLTTLLLIGIHSQVLFVMNAEIIHSLQFGLLACLLFPLIRNFGLTIFLTTIFGYLDEFVQYQILYPDWETYFDFNDTVMDQLGAGLALILLFSAGVRRAEVRPWREYLRNPVILVGSMLILVLLILYQFSFIVAWAGQAEMHTLFMLNEAEGPDGFWQCFEYSGERYHVLKPAEGIGMNLFLIGLYSLMDLRKWKRFGKGR
jgi:hypothetical protein